MVAGSYTATLCIAPEFTGTIESFAAFLGVIANIASATTAGFINQTGSPSEWALIFIITASIILLSGIFFLIFGSGK
uniref:Major facilitator superfamily (MFS) profile domain-containing protein n=1 Tax=Acrobeloides nanus TaxID=290746 RepID=A0A914D292_9BILA